jgi:hypothetical protein
MSEKKPFSFRLRIDQERRMQLMIDRDRELDFSKIIRKAIDEFLDKHVREEPLVKKRSSG